MPARSPNDGADKHTSVHDAGQPGKDLADLNARYARGARFEFAADVDRALGLDVPEVLVRRPATEENIDHRLLARSLAGTRLQLQEIGEIEAGGTQTQRADAQKTPPCESIAIASRLSANRQHGHLIGEWKIRPKA